MSNGPGLKPIQDMVYPGRVIIIGKSLTNEFVLMYAVTGRSPSSQARKLELDNTKKKILVKPTDEDVLKTGNPELLIYPALILDTGITISNGKHTEGITTVINSDKTPVKVLTEGLENWEYEPDEPAYTPRISGCIVNNSAALSIIKRAEDGLALKYYFDIPLIQGKGKMIATYTGVNKNPLPSFHGEPVDIDIIFSGAEQGATEFYNALGPATGNDDFRVAAVVAIINNNGHAEISIKNRHEIS